MPSHDELAALREELRRDGLIGEAFGSHEATRYVLVFERRPTRLAPIHGRRTVRAPRSRRTVRARASRGSPVPLSGDDDPPLPDVVRLPSAGVLYARAAQLERLACAYADLGRADLFYIGCDLAGQLERIADRRAA